VARAGLVWLIHHCQHR